MMQAALIVSGLLILTATGEEKLRLDCGAYEKLDRLPDGFEEISASEYGTFDALTLTDGNCTCDGYPGALKEYAKSIGRAPLPMEDNFICRPSTAEDRKAH
jgi:hypothetical protein